MSLPIPEVIESLKRVVPNIDPKTLVAIENDLEAKEQEVAAERAASPKTKKQTVVVLLDPENRLNGDANFRAISTQISQEDDPNTVPERIYKAAYAQNAGGKRKRWNIRDLGEIGTIKRKWLKENNVAIKSGKEPVQVVVVSGKIPAA